MLENLVCVCVKSRNAWRQTEWVNLTFCCCLESNMQLPCPKSERERGKGSVSCCSKGAQSHNSDHLGLIEKLHAWTICFRCTQFDQALCLADSFNSVWRVLARKRVFILSFRLVARLRNSFLFWCRGSQMTHYLLRCMDDALKNLVFHLCAIF